MSTIDKTKEIIKLTIKEGSINILMLTISCIVIFTLFPNTLISTVLELCWIMGFIVSVGIVIYRIILNQYVILKIRLDKMYKDMEENNYESLKSDNKLFDILTPLVESGIKAIFKKKGITEVDINKITEEIDINKIYNELINENDK